MAANARMKNLAVHFEKIVYGGAAGLAVLIFLIPFLSTRDLPDIYYQLEEARKKLEAKQADHIVVPAAPAIAEALAAQWSVPPATAPWITEWTTEARPAQVRIMEGVVRKVVAHPEGKVAKIVPGRDREKLQVFLHVEGARGKVENAAVKSARLQRKVVLPAPEAGSDFSDLKDFGADQAILYDDFDVKPGSTYVYRLVTEIEPLPETELPKDDPEPLKKVSKEIPLGKEIPWEYRIRIISAVGYDPKTGADASLNGEPYYWDYGGKKGVQSPKTNWKEKDAFGTKLKDGQERYKVLQIEDGKVRVQDRFTTALSVEPLAAKDNKRPVDLPPEVTFEQVAAAQAAPPGESAAKAEKKDAKTEAKAKAKAKEEEADDGETPAKKPAKKPAGKDQKKTDTKKKPDTKKPKPVIK